VTGIGPEFMRAYLRKEVCRCRFYYRPPTDMRVEMESQAREEIAARAERHRRERPVEDAGEQRNGMFGRALRRMQPSAGAVGRLAGPWRPALA
jgi:hypothetical protein